MIHLFVHEHILYLLGWLITSFFLAFFKMLVDRMHTMCLIVCRCQWTGCTPRGGKGPKILNRKSKDRVLIYIILS